MKEFVPHQNQSNKKLKPSKFYDSFIQQKGPNGVTRASSAEIQKALKMFYLDLAFGNIVQDKYIPYIMEEPRVFQEAIIDCENKLIEYTIILRSLEAATASNNPIVLQPNFQIVYNKYLMLSNSYSTILNGLRGFVVSMDVSYLVAISAKLNSTQMRGAKQQIIL